MRTCKMSALSGEARLLKMLRRDRPLLDPETQGALVAILLAAMVFGALIVVFWGLHPLLFDLEESVGSRSCLARARVA